MDKIKTLNSYLVSPNNCVAYFKSNVPVNTEGHLYYALMSKPSPDSRDFSIYPAESFCKANPDYKVKLFLDGHLDDKFEGFVEAEVGREFEERSFLCSKVESAFERKARIVTDDYLEKFEPEKAPNSNIAIPRKNESLPKRKILLYGSDRKRMKLFGSEMNKRFSERSMEDFLDSKDNQMLHWEASLDAIEHSAYHCIDVGYVLSHDDKIIPTNNCGFSIDEERIKELGKTFLKEKKPKRMTFKRGNWVLENVD